MHPTLKLIFYVPKFNFFITCIKNIWQWGIKKCPPSVSEKNKNKCMSMRHEQMFAPLQCLKTMHPPFLAHQKSTLPFFSDCPTGIKYSKQNATPSPYHTHAKKSTTLKHVKTFTHPPTKKTLIFYIPTLFLRENSLFKTIIKNLWQWGMKKIPSPSVFEKNQMCVNDAWKKLPAINVWKECNPHPFLDQK